MQWMMIQWSLEKKCLIYDFRGVSGDLTPDNPLYKVIIFSGFDEFEYAREAIKIEAEEYILKPINANELREVFERIKNNLDKELDEKRNIDKLREYYLESLPMLQENFLTWLIEGRIPEGSSEEYAKNCSLPQKGS